MSLLQTLTYFTPFFSVSTVDSEQVNWEIFQWRKIRSEPNMRNLRTKRENFDEKSVKMNFGIFKNLENHYFPKLVDGYTLK